MLIIFVVLAGGSSYYAFCDKKLNDHEVMTHEHEIINTEVISAWTIFSSLETMLTLLLVQHFTFTLRHKLSWGTWIMDVNIMQRKILAIRLSSFFEMMKITSISIWFTSLFEKLLNYWFWLKLLEAKRTFKTIKLMYVYSISNWVDIDDDLRI